MRMRYTQRLDEICVNIKNKNTKTPSDVNQTGFLILVKLVKGNSLTYCDFWGNNGTSL